MSIDRSNNGNAHLLEPFYTHARANNGLIQFVQEYDKGAPSNRKSKPSCLKNSLDHLFNHETWEKIKTGNGHANYQSKMIEGVHVGYKTHGQSFVDKAHLETIVENVNGLVQTMFNEVYQCEPTLDEQPTPDWNQAKKNYKALLRGDSNNNNADQAPKIDNDKSNNKNSNRAKKCNRR